MRNEVASVKFLSPGETLGPYTIIRRVPGGTGGMSTVYEAQAVGSNQRVALKVAAEGQGAFLRDEATFIKAFRLHHPNIIRLIPTDLGGGASELIVRDPRSGLWYFAMEFMAGGSLADWLERRRRIPLRQALDIVYQIGEALAVSHKAGILHLDVKPGNILFRDNPERARRIQAVLTDFGIARPRNWAQNQMYTLTVEYASPEQAINVRHYLAPEDAHPATVAGVAIGPTSDIYSLLTILYEMLAGRLPFTASDEMSYLEKVMHEPPSLAVAGIPPELVPILERGLAKSPQERYQTAEEMIQALQAAAPPREALETHSLLRMPTALAGVGGILVGLIAGFIIGRASASSGNGALVAPPPLTSSPTVTLTATSPFHITVVTASPTPTVTRSPTPRLLPTSTRAPTWTPAPTLPRPAATSTP